MYYCNTELCADTSGSNVISVVKLTQCISIKNILFYQNIAKKGLEHC